MTLSIRQNTILDLLTKKKSLSNAELCEQLFCSLSTLRRELLDLETNGLIKRHHGGATIISKSNTEFSHFYRETENNEAKAYIASLAVDFIGNGMSIFLDSSSTSFYICEHLRQFHNIIVVTNGLRNAISLSAMDNVKVYLPGGELKTNSTSIVGELTGNFIANFKADLCFLSCRGIDPEGTYEASLNQALFKQHLMANAKQSILLCDETKFDSPHFFNLSSYQQIDALITNTEPSIDYLESAHNLDFELLY